MEELLLDIMKESNGPKGANLRKSCQQAYDLLCTQQGTTRDPSYELRRVCFLPLQVALETKRPKLVTLALNGFHKILRDDRFHRGNEPEDDSLWLPSQLLCATSSMAYHPQETQVHILRVLLALGLRSGGALNGRLVLWLAGRCAEAAVSAPVAAPARAAAAMTIRAFCLSLDEECQELLNEGSPLVKSKVSAVACFSEIIPVMQYLCSRLCETQMTTKSNVTAIFYLECLLTLVTSLPEIVNSNTHFTNFLWQKFCPALISFLGTPRVDKNIKSRDEGHGVDDSGRGSGSLASAPSFNSQQAKTVYSIAGQLLRLVGCVGSMRPVLEALYHRMLLYPPVSHRAEALASTKDILGDPKKLCYLLILRQSNNISDQHSDDMALVRLIMDAIEECAVSNNSHVLLVSLECIVSLLGALEELCEGKYLPPNATEINNKWQKLEDSDYRGPLTYQSLARLPSPYRDLVAEMQSKLETDGTDSSDTSGPEENGSASDGEMDSDADSVFLPSRQHSTYRQESTDNIPTARDHETPFMKSIPSTLNLGRCNITDYNVDVERQNAKQFVKTLQNVMVPKLLSFRTCVEVDESMQDFASKCCQFNAARSPSTSTIMNADGIYLATYSTLLLNLKLIYSGYYKGSTTAVPLSEDDFVEEVHGSGVLVYLSSTWLCEVYQQVLTTSILEIGGYQPSVQEHNALVNLLIDFGGLGTSQVMCDWQRLKEVSTPSGNIGSAEKTAALKLARRVLTCMWDSMVTLLSAPLIGRYSNSVVNLTTRVKLHKLLPRKSRFTLKKDKVREELVSLSLEGLHKAARISNILSLQNRCSSLLALLSDSACSESPSAKIVSSHALSLDVLISGGLELGSRSVDCWRHIFTACQYVSRLEHTLFGQQCNTTTPLITLQTGRNKTVSFTQNSHGNFLSEKLHQSFNFNQGQGDDETCVDIYSFLQSNIDSVATNKKMSVAAIIQKLNKDTNRNNPSGFICGTDAAKVCCALSQQVDALFGDAASKLNLPALCGFLQQLCLASERQLSSETSQSEQNASRWWKGMLGREGKGGPGGQAGGAGGGGGGLLARVGDVTLQCLRAPRPLAHHMAVWTIVGPHYMKAACSKDRRISKKAIQCLHDAITLLLNEQTELPHFHFNEALLKPFENLLCLELCDSDVQEQIISCICQFVEANQTEIRSGWRPLFGTLRAAHNYNQYSAVLEIFRVFLNTDNTLVFANAAVDCVLCLLSYIRGSNIDANNTQKETSSPLKSPDGNSKTVFNLSQRFIQKNDPEIYNANYQCQLTVEICKESLGYIESCAEILGMMYSMPKCPTFNTAHRVNADMPLQVVDALFPKTALHVKQFTNLPDVADCNIISYRILSTALPSLKSTISSLVKFDRPSGILKVWHLLIEGLVSASISCPRQFQMASLETLFKIFQDMMVIPGPLFGLHCINHLLLPSMQTWIRQVSKNGTEWDSFAPNFKQCCGMATDLIVKYLSHLQHEDQDSNLSNKYSHSNQNSPDTSEEESEKRHETSEIKAVTFALKQLLLILVECVSQPHEIIARLGASCIRHIILTSGYLLTQQQWEITCTSLHRACNASLAPLQQLTLAFEENSNSFYGDVAIVKVAARSDSSINDNVRLHSMAQQVFLYDYSKEHSLNMKPPQNYSRQHNQALLIKNLVLTDDRSYIFLLYPQDATTATNPEPYTIRIPHKSLVIGLLAHQILIQIIATILLQKITNIMPLNHILLDTFKSSGLILNNRYALNYKNIDILLKCLDMSYRRAINFDLRPGLKFLVQKVSNLDSAANLYKHTTASWIIKMIALTELHLQGVSKKRVYLDELQNMMDSGNLPPNTINNKFINRSFDLKNTWDMLCDLYINAIEIDCVTADLANSEISDTIHEINSNSIDNEDLSDIEQPDKPNRCFMNSKSASYESVTICGITDKSSESAPKPFIFSDFRDQPVCTDYDSDDDKHADLSRLRSDSIAESEKSSADYYKANGIHGPNQEIEDGAGNDVGLKKDFQYAINKLPTNANTQLNNIHGEPLLPAQPVPPEIEQERIHSITKDAEAKRIALANILAAYLELILSFPMDQFELTAPMLDYGYSRLMKCVSDPLLLQRIEAFSNKRDTV